MVKKEAKISVKSARQELPMADGGIKAGFASPAQDFIENGIDLNKELVHNPSSTFFGRVSGNSMIDAGIEDGDILVIDKSLEAHSGDIAVCFLNGEFTLKRVEIKKDEIWLVPANPKYKVIKVGKDEEFMIWGVVTYTIKDIARKNRGK